MPAPRPVPSAPRPHPHCLLCESLGKACAFHRAAGAAEFATAYVHALRGHGAVGLAKFFLAAFAQLEKLPEPAGGALGALDPGPLTRAFEDWLGAETFDSDDLRQLAATALALAVVSDARDGADSKDGDGDPTQE